MRKHLHIITGIGGALLVALFIAIFASQVAPVLTPQTASPSGSLAPLGPITTPDATSTQAVEQPAVTEQPAAPPAETAAAPAAVSANQTVSPTLALALPQLRSALVNIICISEDKSLKGISGSGVIIDSRGIILTAAHVAQYFLLNDSQKNAVSCVARVGSPASTAYIAKPIYISKRWLTNNPDTLVSPGATGTGEDDFAFLAITESANGHSLPSSFPFVPFSHSTPHQNEPVVIGSYGAEFASNAEIRSSLYPTLVFSTIKDRYTFDADTVDVISLGGTAAAQEGSSGGGAINDRGSLVGMITTSSINQSGDFTERDLHAITPLHIRTSFLADTGTTLDSFFSENVSTLLASFSKKESLLARIIEH